MAVRFRFRSSVKYESVDIEGKPSISVRDLKSKIVHNHNLNICQDFDLLFSDALTGQVYYDEENSQIPSGSSVIIKRVPKGVGGEAFDSFSVKDAKPPVPVNLEVDSFDDFGAELCPILEASTSGSGLGAGKKLQFITKESTNEVTRCFDMASVRCEKPESSELSEAIPRGLLYFDGNEDLYQKNLKPSVGEFKKRKMVVVSYPQDIENVGLPTELRCSLCDTFFMDAVMIPCCQHSFCEKCIRLSLVEKGKCPRCLSTKYKVEDLLPNISLRQAIKRFLESQMLIRGSDNSFGYAPDGESGIQVKEMSCAVNNQQREAQLPHSPCTTGKGSNQIISNAVGGKSSFSSKLKHDAEKQSTHLVCLERQPVDSVTDFQGENQPVYDKAESTVKKKRMLHVHTAVKSMETGRYKKEDRTCYMCGSPDHFIRDCPAASGPNPMHQTGNGFFAGVMPGYLTPYWNGPPISQIRPFANPYGSRFHATMVLPATYAVPTCMPFMNDGMTPFMPFMNDGMTPFSGFTRIGASTSVAGSGAERHLGQSDCLERAGCEGRWNLSHDNLMRRRYFSGDDEDGSYNTLHHSNEAERRYHNSRHRDREDEQDRASRSKECLTKRPHGKHRRRSYFDDEPERSSSEVENMPSVTNRHSEERHKHRQRNFKKHGDGREQGGGHSSHSHHQSTKAEDFRGNNLSDLERQKRKRHDQSGSALEASSSSDKKRRRKDGDSSHSSRHSKHNSKSRNNDPSHDRWQIARS